LKALDVWSHIRKLGLELRGLRIQNGAYPKNFNEIKIVTTKMTLQVIALRSHMCPTYAISIPNR
jgi:hypothetical protein